MNSVKNLFNRFLENGGTAEEFWAGRHAAMQQNAARVENHKKAAEVARRERMAHLMERGYSEFEAKEKIRLEAFEAHDAMGANPISPIVRELRTPYSNVGGVVF